MKQSSFSKKFLFVASGLAAGSMSFASGFEKAVMWSGKYTGIGGAAVSSVRGSESLFFNPAGLASGENIDFSLNVSPTMTQLKGPVRADGESITSKTSTNYPLGVTGKYSLTPDLALGVGFFASGGAGADFGNVDFSTATGVSGLLPQYKSEVMLLEAALGAAYKLAPGLSVGASWRTTFARAQFILPNVTNVGTMIVVSETNIHDLKATNLAGFRAGLQYEPENGPFGLGLSVRTPITFTPKGSVKAQIATSLAATTVTQIADTAASVTDVTFPLQVSLGGHYDVTKDAKVFLQYDFTNYATLKSLAFNGTVTTALGATSLPTITLNSKNMHSVRVAGQYQLSEPLALRLGYIFTSQVMNSQYARPTLYSPGPGHTFTVGAGYALSKELSLDAAFEYAKASGNVTAPATTTPAVKKGTYSSRAIDAHVGATYTF